MENRLPSVAVNLFHRQNHFHGAWSARPGCSASWRSNSGNCPNDSAACPSSSAVWRNGSAARPGSSVACPKSSDARLGGSAACPKGSAVCRNDSVVCPSHSAKCPGSSDKGKNAGFALFLMFSPLKHGLATDLSRPDGAGELGGAGGYKDFAPDGAVGRGRRTSDGKFPPVIFCQLLSLPPSARVVEFF
jgi:hypothetical protein